MNWESNKLSLNVNCSLPSPSQKSVVKLSKKRTLSFLSSCNRQKKQAISWEARYVLSTIVFASQFYPAQKNTNIDSMRLERFGYLGHMFSQSALGWSRWIHVKIKGRWRNKPNFEIATKYSCEADFKATDIDMFPKKLKLILKSTVSMILILAPITNVKLRLEAVSNDKLQN